MFKQRSHLNNHSFIHDQQKPFHCKCGQAFRSSSHLRIHEKSANCVLNDFCRTKKEKRFKCEKFVNKYSTKKALKRHKLAHFCGAPFECKQCCETFREKCVLKAHYFVHSGESLFKCKCGAKYRNERTFRKHQEKCAKNNDEKCDNSSESSSELSDSSSDDDFKAKNKSKITIHVFYVDNTRAGDIMILSIIRNILSYSFSPDQ